MTSMRNKLRGVEQCETRNMLAAVLYHFDVNHDGDVAPVDALQVINYLHSDPTALVDGQVVSEDVNRDDVVSPVDVLLVINALNCHAREVSLCGRLGLSASDPDFNTSLIETYTLQGLQAVIPAGAWPVRPISMDTGGSIVGQGRGVSELRLELDQPGRWDRQDVIATVIPDGHEFTDDVMVSDLSINGNYENIDWSEIYNDGNAFGLYLRAAQDSHFENLEIKNVWTDGIFISTVLGFSNNTRNVDFEDIHIHHAGRQGVSIVGGEHLRFNNFDVSSIGRDGPLHTSPRAAIDIEPEARAQRLVRHVSITNWTINRVGQGVIIDGTNSSVHASDILVRNVTMNDLDGPQSISARYVDGLTVENVVSTGHHAKNGGLGVILNNTNGVVSGLTIRDMSGINYPVIVNGSSFVEMDNLTIDGIDRGVLQIGSEPGEDADNTYLHLSSFAFENTDSTDNRYVPIRIKSNRTVALTDGVMSGTGRAPYAVEHATDVYFHNVDLEAGNFGVFASRDNAIARGTGNSWS